MSESPSSLGHYARESQEAQEERALAAFKIHEDAELGDIPRAPDLEQPWPVPFPKSEATDAGAANVMPHVMSRAEAEIRAYRNHTKKVVEDAELSAILSVEPMVQLNLVEEYDYQNPEIGAIVYKSFSPQVCGKIVTLEQRKEWYGKPHEKFIWYAGVKWLKKGNPITEEMCLDLRSYHVLMEDHRRKYANMRHQLTKLRTL